MVDRGRGFGKLASDGWLAQRAAGRGCDARDDPLKLSFNSG